MVAMIRQGIVLMVLGLLVSNCARKKKIPSFRIAAGEKEQVSGPANEEANPNPDPSEAAAQAELEGFQATLHPWLTDNCAGCHADSVAPYFAAPEAGEALKSLKEGNKVDFENPELSRLVLRMNKDLHNCPTDCEADGQAVLDAIKAWIEASQIKIDVDTSKFLAEKKLTDSTFTLRDGSGSYLQVIGGEQITPEGAIEATEASGGYFYTTYTSDQNADPINNANNSPDRLSVPFSLDQARTVRAYVHYRFTNAEEAHNLFYSFNGGQFQNANLGNQGLTYALIPLGNAQNLTAGANTLELRRNQGGVVIDAIVITDSALGPEELKDAIAREISYDIEQVCGVKGSLRFGLIFNGPDSVVFQDPILDLTSGSVQIKAITPRINQKRNPAYSTFAGIDTTVSAGETEPLVVGNLVVASEEGLMDQNYTFNLEGCQSP